jgi:hypothetical protein
MTTHAFGELRLILSVDDHVVHVVVSAGPGVPAGALLLGLDG